VPVVGSPSTRAAEPTKRDVRVYGLAAVTEGPIALEAQSRPDVRSTVDDERNGGPSALVRIAGLALVLLALAPVLAALLTRTGRHYVPVGDIGLIDMRVRDVLSAHPPLVGPYSRYGWSHPGPLMFWLLAIPSMLFGKAAWATLVGGALLQGAAIIWLAALAWRRGGLSLLAATMVGTSLIYVAIGAWIVLEPWNPHIALPFFALFVFQAWLIATGDVRVVLGAGITSTFVVQTHVGYAPLVAIVAIVAAFFVVRDLRHGRVESRSLISRLELTAIVVAVLWLPVLVETVQNPPGNLAHVAKYFVNGKNAEPAIGLRAGVRLLAAEWRWLPSWLGDTDVFDPLSHHAIGSSGAYLLIPVALLAVGFVVARRGRRTDVERFLVIAAAMLVASPFVLARVTGVPYPYLFYWRPVVAVAVVLGVAGAIWAARSRGRTVQAALVVVAIGLVAYGSGSIGIDVLRHDRAVSTYEGATSSIARQLRARGAPSRGAILRIDVRSLIALQRGIFDELNRHGMRVYADSRLGYEFGSNHARDADDVEQVWWVAESGSTLSYLMSRPDASLIASSTPLDARDEAEARRLQEQLLRELAAVGRTDLGAQLDSDLVAFPLADVPGVDQDAVRRLGDLNGKVTRARTCRCGVVAFPAGSAPSDLPW
jgi:hypothetical protein